MPCAGGKRTINVNVTGTAGKEFKIEAIWLGDDGDKGKYGIYKRLSGKVTADGDTKFSAEYLGKSHIDYDVDYRGFAVRLLDSNGVEVARQASQKPFERFLDEAEAIK